MPTPPLRVAIVAYSPLIRLGLTGLLATHPTRAVVVDQAASDGHLGHHDVAIYDLSGLVHGVEDLQHLVASNTAVLGLVHHGQDELARRAASLRVAGVIGHDISSEGLVDAIETAVRPGAVRPGRRTDPQHPGTVDGKPWGLSEREIDILTLIGQGMPNQDIARQLYLSPNSVKTYIRTAYRKIGVTTRSQAVLWIVRHGLIDGAPQQRALLGDD